MATTENAAAEQVVTSTRPTALCSAAHQSYRDIEVGAVDRREFEKLSPSSLLLGLSRHGLRPHQARRRNGSGAQGGGGSAILQSITPCEHLSTKDSVDELRHAYHSRFHEPAFPEFAQVESREFYRIKKEKTIGSFDVALAKTPELVKQTEKLLEELAVLFHSNRAVNAGGVSDDDIDLFGRLRGLTLVKGLKWPKKLREYIDYYAEAADIPLLDSMAQY